FSPDNSGEKPAYPIRPFGRLGSYLAKPRPGIRRILRHPQQHSEHRAIWGPHAEENGSRLRFQVCDGRLEPVMLVVVAEGLSFGIGRLRPVPTSALAFAVPAFESV